jgi:hypothetical protein
MSTQADPGCFWHGAEPIPAGAYRVCGECWHCWPTPDDLLRDVLRIYAEIGLQSPPDDADQVWVCPLCSHDF